MKNYVLLGTAICAMSLFTNCKETYGFDDIEAPSTDVSVRNHTNRYAPQNAVPGVLLVKVAKTADVNLESFSASDLTLMGVSSPVMQAFKTLSVRSAERLFRPHPKFPNMEKRFGLDRWYRITFDETKSLIWHCRASMDKESLKWSRQRYACNTLCLSLSAFHVLSLPRGSWYEKR
ncbi:subtilase family N-terminal domain-containing protein [Porphyromonas cangingivalis]|uniref:subtilase family N-terminal domain-containing protein n=1 Tax=Porphyromonas cangingivalis TaxID=36874 RepID=UPI0009DD7C5B|nr:subtilase family N-terminal domain-containing protein [Porphyromonas cangingivalis]